MTDFFKLTARPQRPAAALLAIAAAMVLWACAGDSADGNAGTAGQGEASTAAAPEANAATSYSVSRYVKDANQAVGLAFDNKGRLIYNEKDSGRIIRFANGTKTVLAKLGVAGGGESGLLGLTSDKSGNVYAYYTGPSSSCPDPTKSSPQSGVEGHCAWAFKPTSNGRLKADHMVFSSNHPSSAENHVGGGLHIGPDGALYLSIGDLGENDDPDKGPGRAQNLSLPFGKLLRLDPSGSNRAAAGNPGKCGNVANTSDRNAADERIFACGLRNTYSFAFDVNNRIWGSEAGDGCDEINVIKSGVNYGWEPPRTDCSGQGAGRPVLKVTGTPSGIAVPTSKSAGGWRNDVFYCVFNDAKLVRYDQGSRKRSTLSKAGGKCTYDLAARGSYLYMSSGDAIYRVKIKR